MQIRRNFGKFLISSTKACTIAGIRVRKPGKLELPVRPPTRSPASPPACQPAPLACSTAPPSHTE